MTLDLPEVGELYSADNLKIPLIAILAVCSLIAAISVRIGAAKSYQPLIRAISVVCSLISH